MSCDAHVTNFGVMLLGMETYGDWYMGHVLKHWYMGCDLKHWYMGHVVQHDGGISGGALVYGMCLRHCLLTMNS